MGRATKATPKVAKAALAGPWHVNRAPAQQGPGLQIVDEAGLVVTWTPGFYKRGDGDATHIARHDPARGLREVEAGRAILAEYQRVRRALGPDLLGPLRRVLCHLAAVYDGHPEYQQGWKP